MIVIQNFFFFFMLVVLACVSGCIPYHKIVRSEFPQADEKKDNRAIVYNYLREVPVYDQFRTLAIFNVLWLSDEVRSCYVDLYGIRRGKDVAAREVLLKRQLEENQHWISFYVLADIRNKTPHLSLHDKNAYWTVFLETADKKIRIEPVFVKEVELDPEYESLFSYRLNAFKTPYLIKFPTKDLTGKRYFAEGACLTLVLSSPDREVKVTWDKNSRKNQQELLKDEDRYWS